ncbi:polysaccharide deacetylase family protein [Paenibacillus oenotherae]|uniref:Polysaccharide deacetylase family protein n=2 Tax=Paenibacillus oenotherae TaxID=1435645 RepID=A0ABS7D106_9BACL|nr:polysaccharide deacetylase family protein [Paenibacillus oenotherae]
MALVMGIMMCGLLLTVQLNEDVADYVWALKQGESREVMAGWNSDPKSKDSLLERIEAEAAKRRIAPVDARLDRIWKAIPGYNGLEVDVERTYQLMKASPPDAQIRYIYKEIPPRVQLSDLGVHPIYRGNPDKPMVALMINVAWGNEYLEPMLNILDKENVKATFFLDGSWLKKNADAARNIQAHGHEMSNHAYSHPDMSKLDRQAAYNQIAKTEKLLQSTLQVTNRWFAPPSGDYNGMTVKVAAEQGLRTVLWTLDTVDWQHPPAWAVINKIKNRVTAGSLILMHPTDSSSQALEGMIRAIKQKGLSLGTVSDTLSSDRVPLVEAGL